ncbi:hypothetical protein BKA62DRAFT_659769 [Auriculariales sp. MPI-PUGE-AT-0066]|nr:hypothetical protein BKA62DRAFT_659769 [Auriculariales sp. MPI-PUGE-AT-0066]
MFTLTSLLVAVLSTATSVSAATVRSSASSCEGFRPVNEIFSLPGYTNKYIMDVNDKVANPSSWDWNTTKIYYGGACPLFGNETREIAFVNLDDCSPVTSRYTRLPSMDRISVSAYDPSLGPTIGVTADENAVARFTCYGSEGTGAHLTYEVHLDGLNRDEMLAGLGFYDKVVSDS